MPLDSESTRTSYEEQTKEPSNFQVHKPPSLLASFSLSRLFSPRFYSRTRGFDMNFLPAFFRPLFCIRERKRQEHRRRRAARRREEEGRAKEDESFCPKKLRARALTRRRGLNNTGFRRCWKKVERDLPRPFSCSRGARGQENRK